MLRAVAEYELLVCSRDAQLRMRTNAKLSRTNSLDSLLLTRDRRTSRPPSDESLPDHCRPGARREPSRPSGAARHPTRPALKAQHAILRDFGQRARPQDCPSTQNRKRRPTTMGNGASCGENARDVGADEELNPMLMGDADKENHYRRPSVPHVQAVLQQRPPVITAFF